MGDDAMQSWQTIGALPAPDGWRVVISTANGAMVRPVAAWLQQRPILVGLATFSPLDVDEFGDHRIVPGIAYAPTTDADPPNNGDAEVDAAHHHGDVVAFLAPGEPVPEQFEGASE